MNETQDDKKKLETTATFPAVGLTGDLPNIKYQDILANETAFKMFINEVSEKDKLYSEKVCEVRDLTEKLDRATQRVANLEKRASERFCAVIISTVAEVVTAIGIGILPSNESKTVPLFVILAGVLMTILSLWLNFKPDSKENETE